MLAEREKREGVPDECVPVMCALVGYEHASPSTRAWLDGMVLIQSENKSIVQSEKCIVQSHGGMSSEKCIVQFSLEKISRDCFRGK